MTTTLSIDATKRQGVISPLLFGHNLEHTRNSMWQGLSAQLLRNRKFAGKPERTGNAMQWYRVGPRHVFLDHWSADAYTEHVDRRNRRRNERFAQKIQSASTEVCGIGQRDLPLLEGREYEMRLVLKADRHLSVQVRFAGQNGGPEYHIAQMEVPAGDWDTYTFRFVMPVADVAACVEITFTGSGTLIIGAVSLLPADHFHGMRRDVIELLKEIRVPVLRWPGGNFAGDFRWQDGLLPVDKRGPLMSYSPMETLPHSSGYDEHDVGIDEFMALCRETGAEAFISVNLGHEGPEEAAAWVEYCNGPPHSEWGSKRAARGQSEPYGVKYWSVGNEMGYGHMEGPNEPDSYAAKARETAQAMLTKDPNIILVLSGRYDKDNEWYTQCLEPMADIIHHVSDHYYTSSVASYLGEEGIAECRRLASEPDRVAARLSKIRGYINAHVPNRDIGISFDEWNVWYGWYREPGVNEGIHTAAMLNMFVREALNIGMTLGCFFEPVNEGAIIVEPDRAWLTASGQVFALFAAHHNNASLQLDGWDTDVDAAASIDAEQGRLVMTLVNRDPVDAREVTLRLNHIHVSGTLLSADRFLPASRFEVNKLEIVRKGKEALTAVLPKHSVAKIDIDLKGA